MTRPSNPKDIFINPLEAKLEDPKKPSSLFTISGPMVMKSAAGYYVGSAQISLCSPGKCDPLPYDRYSYGYYSTESQAADEWSEHADEFDWSGFEKADESYDYLSDFKERKETKATLTVRPFSAITDIDVGI